MSPLHGLLQQWWYANRRPPWLVRRLSDIYAALRSSRVPSRRHEYPACIIVVGNIVAGGAGKTPLVMALCHLLQAQNFRVGVIARGYGRRSRALQWVDAESTVRDVGDEPLLIHRETGVPVVVARQRRQALEALLARHELDVVLADDGLQHADLPRDLEICLIDGERGLGNGLLLPAGPLREPPELLARVDRVVYKGSQPQTLPLGDVMTVSVSDAVNLARGEWRALSSWRDSPVTAVAGIAAPDSFFRVLEASGLRISAQELGDHQACTPRQAREWCEAGDVLMTAKDAVKWPQAWRERAWMVPMRVQLPPALQAWVLSEVARVCQHRRLAAQQAPARSEARTKASSDSAMAGEGMKGTVHDGRHP